LNSSDYDTNSLIAELGVIGVAYRR
jgi:hypothetical protein